MYAVAHLFTARSRAAIIWFLVTLASIAASLGYVENTIAQARTQPLYVMAGSPELHYISPTLEEVRLDARQALHAEQSRLAMETLFNRTPSGLEHTTRRLKLFSLEANRQINQDIIIPQVKPFREYQIHQKVEIESIVVNLREGQAEADVTATALLFRTGIENGQTLNQTWSVKVFFSWTRNPDITWSTLYPTQCREFALLRLTQLS